MSNDEPNFLLERFFERFHCTYPLNVHDMTLHEMTQIIDAFIFVYFRLFSMFFSLSHCRQRRLVVVRDIRRSLAVVRRINGSMKTSSQLLPQGLSPFETSISSLSLTPKERHLVIGLNNGRVRIVALNAQYLRDRLQERLSSLGF